MTKKKHDNLAQQLESIKISLDKKLHRFIETQILSELALELNSIFNSGHDKLIEHIKIKEEELNNVMDKIQELEKTNLILRISCYVLFFFLLLFIYLYIKK